MLNRKKILIFGPLGDFGGRELEAGFIANILSAKYDVAVLTSSSITHESQLFDFNKNLNAFSINDLLYKTYYSLKILSFFSYLKNKKKGNKSSYANNGIAKKYFNYNAKRLRIIRELLPKYDLLFICAQLTTAFLDEVIQIAKENNIKVVFRTTGAIGFSDYDFISSVDCFIHHSVSNASRIQKDKNHTYVIIDQCAYNEKELLEIPLVQNRVSTFLTLGRLVKEKNFDIVIKAFQKIKEEGDILYILGDGKELNNLKRIANNEKDVVFTGFIDNKDLHLYFSLVDCVIISHFYSETGPLTGIEAMAGSRLIISAKTGAMQDRLPYNRYWFNNSVDDLAMQMILIKALALEEVLLLSQRIRTSYLEDYSINRISEEYLKTIDNILK
ncbi:MAG: hypothetical protein COZ75_02130 [Flavobacteriaceae bacterium CG_4_8_14_3_um_filter_34_10]|nr:MAG: hypothetical protein COZ75_02130 [Flavobacteriaceae bacterium CG_4_8_14_3_um_filter_34_10]